MLVLSQYTSITLPFPIVFNGGWSSMSQYIEKGLLSPKQPYPTPLKRTGQVKSILKVAGEKAKMALLNIIRTAQLQC